MLGVKKNTPYKKVQRAKAPRQRINASLHFKKSLFERSFDLSVLVPLYIYISENLKNLKREEDMEFTIGRSTIAYSVGLDNNIQLITGWVGNRNKY